ncbi:MAG: DUF2332 family protein [Pseudomonadota bacterium]
MTVRAAFEAQGPICASLGSPFMGRLMPLIGNRLQPGSAVADRILAWPGDTTAAGDSVPLRLAGALHALKLDGLALGDVYPPHNVDDDQLWHAVEQALLDHNARVQFWLNSPPQTNEVRRAAVILPALARVAALFDQPVELLELGASAGLNLRCDQFWLDLPGGGIGAPGSAVHIAPEWTGPVPTGPLPRIVRRAGVDLNPLSPDSPEDRLRLLAYTWPDQDDRIARITAAFDIAGRVPATVDAGDAADWLEQTLAAAAPDRVRVVFHTVAWQYFPEATKARALAAFEGSASSVVRIAMEADGGHGAAVTMTVWPGGKTTVLGRASFHGIWVNWQDEA